MLFVKSTVFAPGGSILNEMRSSIRRCPSRLRINKLNGDTIRGPS